MMLCSYRFSAIKYLIKFCFILLRIEKIDGAYKDAWVMYGITQSSGAAGFYSTELQVTCVFDAGKGVEKTASFPPSLETTCSSKRYAQASQQIKY